MAMQPSELFILLMGRALTEYICLNAIQRAATHAPLALFLRQTNTSSVLHPLRAYSFSEYYLLFTEQYSLFTIVHQHHRQPRRVVSEVHLRIEKGENICNSTK